MEERKEHTRTVQIHLRPADPNMMDPSSLARLLALREERAKAILPNLQAIIEMPEDHTAAVQLLHTFLRDLLLDRQRCCDPAFWIDQ